MAANRRNCIIIAAAVAFSVIILTIVLTVRFRPRRTPAVVGPPVANSANLTSVRKKGAVCLDGSTPQYHLDRGSGAGANSWLVHLEGGAWCDTVESCLERSRTWLGSSSSLYMDPQEFDGIMSPVPSENPDFYNWNRVMVRYCDGASFSGDVEAEFEQNGAKLFFRGRRIWEAVMSDLISKGLADAEKVVWLLWYTVTVLVNFCPRWGLLSAFQMLAFSLTKRMSPGKAPCNLTSMMLSNFSPVQAARCGAAGGGRFVSIYMHGADTMFNTEWQPCLSQKIAAM